MRILLFPMPSIASIDSENCIITDTSCISIPANTELGKLHRMMTLQNYLEKNNINQLKNVIIKKIYNDDNGEVWLLDK